MLGLGNEASAALMKHLMPIEVERIGIEIAKMGKVDGDVAEPVLKEFVQHTLEGSLRGGRDFACKLVESSLGAEDSRSFIGKIGGSSSSQKLESFGNTDPEHLAKFIQNEHPQTIALVVAHLERMQGAQVFALLPDDLRAEVSLRMASLQEISPEVMDRIASVLEQKLRAFGDFRRETYGGVRAVAELLNRLDRTVSRDVLENLEAQQPDVALSVRNLMFVFDDLLLLEDASIRQVLQQIDKKTLTLALKGTTTELQKLFFRNMSERASDNLKEEMDLMGPVKLIEVEEAQKAFVDTVKKLEEEGVVSIGSGAEEYVL